jgi:hypothetical protein
LKGKRQIAPTYGKAEAVILLEYGYFVGMRQLPGNEVDQGKRGSIAKGSARSLSCGSCSKR